MADDEDPDVRNNGRNADGTFARGNPGKRPGTRHRITVAAEELLEEHGARLTAKAITLALSGDVTALKLCMDRLIPLRRERPVKLDLPPIGTAADAVRALGVIAAEVAGGRLTPGEAERLARVVQGFVSAFEATELEARLAEVERRLEGRS